MHICIQNLALLFSVSHLNFHASNRFAQLEHDKDQARVNRLSATGTGLLSMVGKQQLVLFFCMDQTSIKIQCSTILERSCPVLLMIYVVFSTSWATAGCISCRRCGGMQLLPDTWGPPGILCRSDRSLGSPQTAPHHSPRSVLTPLGPPGCGPF